MGRVSETWETRDIWNGRLYSPPAPELGEGPYELSVPVPDMLGGELPGSVGAVVMGGVRFVREGGRP